MRGDDVGGVAAATYDAVHLVARPEVLAEEPDRDLRDGERVGGVDAELGRRGGVRLVAGVANREVRRPRSTRGRHVLDRCRVHHHRRVHAVERAAFEEEDLAAAAFLGRCADDADRQAELVDERRERERRRRPRSRR